MPPAVRHEIEDCVVAGGSTYFDQRGVSRDIPIRQLHVENLLDIIGRQDAASSRTSEPYRTMPRRRWRCGLDQPLFDFAEELLAFQA
jgi:hypothetical protein